MTVWGAVNRVVVQGTGVRRAVPVIAVTLLLAVALSGCIVIKLESATQVLTIGKVKLTTTICASGYGGCPNGNQGAISNFAGTTQALVAYRLPEGATGPTTFTSISTGPANTTPGALVFTVSTSYATQMEGLSPTNSTEHWVGYISAPFTYNAPSGGEYEFTIAPEFELPANADGPPFAGPFKYRTVVGYRNGAQTVPADGAVNCGVGFTNSGNSSATNATRCADSPTSAPGGIDTNLVFDSLDAGIVGGGDLGATAGTTATVPFYFKFAGNNAADLSFAMTASTTAPGVSATPADAAIVVPLSVGAPPRAFVKATAVDLALPASLVAGTYGVTLTATLGSETRSQTRQLIVAAPPPPVPTPETGPTAPPPTTTPPVAEVDSDIDALPQVGSSDAFVEFSGSASGPSGVDHVDVALLRVSRTGALASGSSPKCRFVLRSGRIKRAAPNRGRCGMLLIRAKGITKWSMKLTRQLRAGRYVLYSRATDIAGYSERQYSSTDKNRAVFRVR